MSTLDRASDGTQMVVLTSFYYQLGEEPGSIRVFGTNPQTSSRQTEKMPVFANATFRDAPRQPFFRLRPGLKDTGSAFCFISSKYKGEPYSTDNQTFPLILSDIDKHRDEKEFDTPTTADSQDLTVFPCANVYFAKQAETLFVGDGMADAHDLQCYRDVNCTVEKVSDGYRIRFVDESNKTQTLYAPYTAPGYRATFPESTGGFPSWTASIPKGYRTALRTGRAKPLFWRDPKESNEPGKVWTGLTLTTMVLSGKTAEESVQLLDK